jgi:serine/threonine-protein kinase HipA
MRQLRVMLGDVPVGTLSLDDQSRTVFRVSETYKRLAHRPVLGQWFLDDLDAEHKARTRLPPWFANLLPEGALRELLVRQLGGSAANEFLLLQSLAGDLPGAVRVLADVDDPGLPDAALAAAAEHRAVTFAAADRLLRFSLAGVQLKFSAQREGHGLTVPMSGRGGNWIVKLPDQRFAGVPRNEFATMNWARAAGISVPETSLLALADVAGLPPGLGPWPEEAEVLAVRRFDRPDSGRRIHIEDFAQVLGVFPDDKYDRANVETLGRLVLAITGRAGLEEWLRRVVFMIASGNGDAHLKNWSLIYPDGVSAELSPAYDLVSTVLFMPADRLALNFGKTKEWAGMNREVFQRLAGKLGLPEGPVMACVDQAVLATVSAWRQGAADFGHAAAERERLLDHMRRVPLLAPHIIRAA